MWMIYLERWNVFQNIEPVDVYKPTISGATTVYVEETHANFQFVWFAA